MPGTTFGVAAAVERRSPMLLYRAPTILGEEWTSSGAVRRLSLMLVLAETWSP